MDLYEDLSVETPGLRVICLSHVKYRWNALCVFVSL